ncbi:MAG: hypothetical protein Crog4KO_33270 [Crocinitomicaceae bacterium]
MRYLVLAAFPFFFFQCTESEERVSETSVTATGMSEKPTKDRWTFKAVPLDSKGWGYQLFRGSHLEIFQKNVPAISGLHTFDSQEQAELAAEFALTKIEQGFFPPTVELEELDSIGAINLDSLLQVNEETLQN